MIKVTTSGSFKNTEKFFQRAEKARLDNILHRFGQAGVDALSSATPVDSRATAAAWRYEVTTSKGESTLSFYNDNEQDGQVIAILIQYGHATGTGGYVVGRDFINPAIRPIFDQIVDEMWKLVKK